MGVVSNLTVVSPTFTHIPTPTHTCTLSTAAASLLAAASTLVSMRQKPKRRQQAGNSSSSSSSNSDKYIPCAHLLCPWR